MSNLQEFTITDGVLVYFHSERCEDLGNVIIPEGVTKIEKRAFQFSAGLRSVTIPESVTEIGEGAFMHCTSLTTICIPNRVTEIQKDTFLCCTSLSSVTLPGSVRKIGERAFQNTALDNILLPYDLRVIKGSAFEHCAALRSIVIPDRVVKIESLAFWECTSLASVTLPDNLCQMGGAVFYHCESLTAVTLPKSLKELSNATFEGCTSLASVTIPDSVTIIERSAFEGCTSLSSIFIPKSVEKIEPKAFLDCDSLVEVTVDGENPVYRAIDGVLYEKSSLRFCPSSKSGSVTVEAGIKRITNHAFRNCKKVTEVHLPDSITSMGAQAFCGCESLRRLVLPPNVSKINTELASGCKSLEEIVLPKKLKSIGKGAFSGTALRWITIPKKVAVDKGAFSGYGEIEEVVLEEGISLAKSCFEDRTIKRLVICGKKLEFTPSSLLAEVKVVVTDELLPGDFSRGPLKEAAVVGFCQRYLAGEELPLKEPYLKYMKSQRKHLYSLAVASQEVLLVMFRENLLINKDIDPLLEKAGEVEDQETKAAITAILLEHSKDMAPVDYAAELDEELAKADRREAYIEKHGTLPVSELQKIWSYKKKEDGTLVITSYKGGLGADVTVPAKIGKTAVTELGSAFDCSRPTGSIAVRKEVRSVILSEGITEIGENAFRGCTGLIHITLAKSVTKIGNSAFEGCAGLTDANIPEGVTKIGHDAFSECTSLTSVTIPAGVREIDAGVFSRCTGLTSVTISKGVRILGYYAFGNCTALTSVTIPNGVTKIDSNAFGLCTALITAIIPVSVTEIADGAFWKCGRLTIHASTGSCAEAYAKKEGIRFKAL